VSAFAEMNHQYVLSNVYTIDIKKASRKSIELYDIIASIVIPIGTNRDLSTYSSPGLPNIELSKVRMTSTIV
jgi:hypothetical protein